MKNLKDEIEGIMNEHSYKQDVRDFGKPATVTQYKAIDLVEAITSLIEQEKERAIEELHNFVRSNTIGGRFMDDSGGYFNADAVLREDIEQYLAERKGE